MKTSIMNKVEIPEATPSPRRSPWDWSVPLPWTCPRCLLTIWTREAGPRCLRCGTREGT